MPTIGYIMAHTLYGALDEDKKLMKDFGCEEIIEERSEFEKMRPKRKELLKSLGCNDTLVVAKLSNVVESTSELAFLFDYCRRERVRIISIHDQLDSQDGFFPAKSTAEIMDIIAAIPDEVAAIKSASKRVAKIKKISLESPGKVMDKNTRDNKIVELYKAGLPVNKIWKISGFRSRSSVFRILKDKGIIPCRYAERRKENGDEPANGEI